MVTSRLDGLDHSFSCSSFPCLPIGSKPQSTSMAPRVSSSRLPYTPERGPKTGASEAAFYCLRSLQCHSGKPYSLWNDYMMPWIPEKGGLQGASWRLPNTVMLNKTGQVSALVELAPLEERGEDDNKPISKYTDAFGSFKGNEENQTR